MGNSRISSSILQAYIARAGLHVVPDAKRCMQCGICSFNCPMHIDVRFYARHGLPNLDSRCLTCGECVARCPRGTLRFERTGPVGKD